MTIDMSMRGPLSKQEQGTFDSWMEDFDALVKRVPKCQIEPAEFGQWRIERWEVTEQDSWHLLRKDLRNKEAIPKAWTPPGTYTRLVTDKPTEWGFPGGEIMQDGLIELQFIDDCLKGASGDVLEVGLGLGLFITACIQINAITSLTVLEIDPDIAGYVGKRFDDSRLRIINTDFRKWSPDRRFDKTWFDTIDKDAIDGRAKFEAISGDFSSYAELL